MTVLPFPAPIIATGSIIRVKAGLLYARIPTAFINASCMIKRFDGSEIQGQVIGFEDNTVTIAPFGSLEGLSTGAAVTCCSTALQAIIPEDPVGYVLDTFGSILFNGNERYHTGYRSVPVNRLAPEPLSRTSINSQIATGVRSVDTFCPLGLGQRVGLFAGPGTGKSTLLATFTKNTEADVIVIGLIGERGREVQEFVQDTLGPAGMERAVVIVATSDSPAITRQYAAYTATAIAEDFRDQGKNVLLLIDSLTRTARAIREVNLAAGELPVRQGYTPTVYSELPKLLERAGKTQTGSITAIYSVLTTATGKNDALAEEIVSLLDGHIVLSEKRAVRGLYPAVAPIESLSRLATQLLPDETRQAVIKVKKTLQLLEDEKEFVQFGATPSSELAAALTCENELDTFFMQERDTISSIENAHAQILSISARIHALEETIPNTVSG